MFLLTPVLAGPLWRVALVLGLLLLTLISGLPRSLWWRSLVVLALLALAVGTLSMLLPAADPPRRWRSAGPSGVCRTAWDCCASARPAGAR